MSLIHIAKALKTKVGNTTTKFVLVKLADNANDDGVCWPSYNHIADQCEISRRSAMRHVKILVELGLVSLTYRSGEKGNSSNVFRLKLDSGTSDKLSPPSEEVVTEDHQPSDTQTPPPSDTVSPRTSHSFEPVNEPKKINKKVSTKTQKGLDFTKLGLEQSEIIEFKVIRKSKKAVISQRVIDSHANEFELSRQAGMSNDDILTLWANKGWAAYRHEWAVNALGRGNKNPPTANQIGAADADYSRPEGY